MRIAAFYAVFGFLWILLSDWAVVQLTGSPDEAARWQILKGWTFVVASAALIFLLVRREARGRESAERVAGAVLDLLPDPVAVRRAGERRYLVVNQAYAALLGRTPEACVGHTAAELGVVFDPDEWDAYADALAAHGAVRCHTLHVTLPDGSRHVWLASSAMEPLGGEECVVATVKDVTELVRTREEAEAHVRRIQALRDIDMAITASLDIRVTLRVVVDRVIEELRVDAASVLLYGDALKHLEYAAGRGFRTDALRTTKLELGEGYAGQAAARGEMVEALDLETAPDGIGRSARLAEEGFRSYWAVPLVAKGQVNGVLEVFHRERLEPTQAWYDFLEVLAGQAAIAIDNAELFRNIQRTNQRLSQAYEETIAGWARALDLRDRETHGHTQRVAELTMQLARRLGVEGDDLMHMRFGALLHDIGKMGVPDAILLKPGELDEGEWEVMRRHPELAYRLLSPIEYLRPALAIPYCHHERWDGSGYPRGLKGEEIPLAARIFAVVDVWDALLSDRPYREAWSEEEARAHLIEEAGGHFDPRVVDVFLKLDLEGLERPRCEPTADPEAA